MRAVQVGRTIRWEAGRAWAAVVDDDLGLVFEFGMEFVFDGGEGAEEEIADVGHDGGAARVDLVPGLEFMSLARVRASSVPSDEVM